MNRVFLTSFLTLAALATFAHAESARVTALADGQPLAGDRDAEQYLLLAGGSLTPSSLPDGSRLWRLHAGRLDARVPEGESKAEFIQVFTKYFFAAIPPARFVVGIDPHGRAQLSVTEGAVRVTDRPAASGLLVDRVIPAGEHLIIRGEGAGIESLIPPKAHHINATDDTLWQAEAHAASAWDSNLWRYATDKALPEHQTYRRALVLDLGARGLARWPHHRGSFGVGLDLNKYSPVIPGLRSLDEYRQRLAFPVVYRVEHGTDRIHTTDVALTTFFEANYLGGLRAQDVIGAEAQADFLRLWSEPSLTFRVAKHSDPIPGQNTLRDMTTGEGFVGGDRSLSRLGAQLTFTPWSVDGVGEWLTRLTYDRLRYQSEATSLDSRASVGWDNTATWVIHDQWRALFEAGLSRVNFFLAPDHRRDSLVSLGAVSRHLFARGLQWDNGLSYEINDSTREARTFHRMTLFTRCTVPATFFGISQ